MPTFAIHVQRNELRIGFLPGECFTGCHIILDCGIFFHAVALPANSQYCTVLNFFKFNFCKLVKKFQEFLCYWTQTIASGHYNRSNEIPLLGEVAKCCLLISVSEKQRSVDSIPKENYRSTKTFRKITAKYALEQPAQFFHVLQQLRLHIVQKRKLYSKMIQCFGLVLLA